jgi:hypothetical protein
VQFCLNFHVKGLCNTACTRRKDHRAHSAVESATFLAFLQQQTAALAAAPQQA